MNPAVLQMLAALMAQGGAGAMPGAGMPGQMPQGGGSNPMAMLQTLLQGGGGMPQPMPVAARPTGPGSRGDRQSQNEARRMRQRARSPADSNTEGELKTVSDNMGKKPDNRKRGKGSRGDAKSQNEARRMRQRARSPAQGVR